MKKWQMRLSAFFIQRNGTKMVLSAEIPIIMPVVFFSICINASHAYAQTANPYTVGTGSSVVIDKNTTVNTDSATINGHLTIDGGTLNETSKNTGQYKIGLVYVNGTSGDLATMTVENGGSLVVHPAGNIVAGLDAGQVGTLTVTGAGSNMSAGFLQAGNSGDGTINILDGATASVTQTILANISTAVGALNISGSGSKLITSTLYVNGDGNGTVTISNGGEVDVSTQIIFGSEGVGDGVLTVENGSVLAAGGNYGLVVNPTAKGSYLFTIDNSTLENIQSNLITYVNIGIANTATFQTNSYTTALGGIVYGTGNLNKEGAGTLLMVEDSTYTGATTITQGALQLGNGGTTGSIASSSAIHDNGALVVNRSNTLTLAQRIDGTGSLTQAGTGTTVLSADNSYTGATTVESGTLDVEGSIAASAVTVLSGSTLEGTGSVGSTLIEKGATLAPIGMTSALSVQGNLEMADGATLSVHEDHHPSGTTMEVNGQAYDQLNSGTVAVTGTTALSGTLNVNMPPGTLMKSHEYYTLITSDGGFSSKADTLQSNLTNLYTFLSPSLYYTNNDLDLLISRNDVTFSSVVGTRNERAVAQVLDSLPESNVLVQGMESLDAAEARQSMNAVSGEVYASARTALIQDSVYVRQAALDRLETADCQEGGMSGAIHTASLATGRKDEGCLSGQAVLWGETYGGLGRNNGDGNAASMHHSTTGFIMGLDTPIMDGKWRIGGLFSYGRSMFDVGSGRGSTGHSNNITVGGYAGTHWGALSLKLGASYTWNMLSMQRNVAISDYASRQSSSYSGGTAQAFGELGYRFHTAYGTVETFGNVAYVNLDTHGYQEEGGAAALQGRGTNTGVTFSTFGVKMFKSVQVGKLLLLPHGSLAYRRAFGLLTPTNHTMLASVGSGDMDVAGVALSQDSAMVDAGMNVRLTDRVDVGLSYIGQYGNQSVESGAMGRAHFRF